jgi:hypothetical protein
MSPLGPDPRFAAARKVSAMEGKPDGRRTRPEPPLVTRSERRSAVKY